MFVLRDQKKTYTYFREKREINTVVRKWTLTFLIPYLCYLDTLLVQCKVTACLKLILDKFT